ncbi:MAG: hypothetical protein LHW64_09570 [Candidatus Cloacimonetes bacterium]|nr:hypothetical protein [Candidatus Cloacimonadota bacterium]MDY0230361.1 hypothetical protein [Candidatus Cloacimonadaceae bacterium]
MSPGNYRWSSHQINALGKTSDLCTPHPEYLMLGTDSKERCEKYLALFEHDIHEQGIDLIRKATNKGMVVDGESLMFNFTLTPIVIIRRSTRPKTAMRFSSGELGR